MRRHRTSFPHCLNGCHLYPPAEMLPNFHFGGFANKQMHDESHARHSPAQCCDWGSSGWGQAVALFQDADVRQRTLCSSQWLRLLYFWCICALACYQEVKETLTYVLYLTMFCESGLLPVSERSTCSVVGYFGLYIRLYEAVWLKDSVCSSYWWRGSNHRGFGRTAVLFWSYWFFDCHWQC